MENSTNRNHDFMTEYSTNNKQEANVNQENGMTLEQIADVVTKLNDLNSKIDSLLKKCDDALEL